MEAEFTVLPRPLHLMVTLQKIKNFSLRVSLPVCLPVSNKYCPSDACETYLHDLVQNSHDAVRGSSEVWFGR